MSKKALMIGGLAGVLVLGAGGGGAYFYMQNQPPEEAVEEPETVGMLELEGFLTNISGGNHHARVQVSFAISPAEKVDELGADPVLSAKLRDLVLTRLSAATYGEQTKPEGKEAFRTNLKKSVADVIDNAEVKEVLFADFVIQ